MPSGSAKQPSAPGLRAALRGRRAPADARFDALLPRRLRALAPVHWTPLEVCFRGIELLAPRRGERILDIGSGVGKFCITAALRTQASFVGVELRPNLVRTARRIARAVGASRSTFVWASAFSVDWNEYQGLYFFNPFAELDLPADHRVDDQLECGPRAWSLSRRRTRSRLRALPAGVRVLVFYDLGLELPPGFTLRRREQVGANTLELWVKEAPAGA